MDQRTPAVSRVVDLLRYKLDHPQRRLSFQLVSGPRPALAPVTAFRPLSARELEHRQAMVKHLASRSRRPGGNA
jgi:hypothetical protein